ncbi:MAG: hypothetical protein EHM40_12960 [Chloroflexi bacterium]|nr:MAG: hypothetical protein EHM40_12960 [Chloroflexota bacterium]
MSRLPKFLTLIVVVLFLLACSFLSQPVQDAENLAETAQSIGSAIPVETLNALATNMPDFGNILNPQGAPVQQWMDIPIMPQATAGQEFIEKNAYSFQANATMQDVQAFYNEKLTALDWDQPYEVPMEDDAGLMIFQKENSILSITITSSEDSVVVILKLVSAS